MHLRGVPWWVGPLVALAGVACMAVGVWRGEAVVVLRKAVAICLECIGIG
ncbi:MAG: thioredoxin [Coriobacteriia bacterium]|nr:thioredoxin [Coriobacteriia bacterium]MBS5477188.1 thioredoxin [Coriobacteriia bacterium]